MIRDPLTDPQPGDVVRIMPNWTRTVVDSGPDYVWFRAKYYDKGNSLHSVSKESWIEASKSAEVLNVA